MNFRFYERRILRQPVAVVFRLAGWMAVFLIATLSLIPGTLRPHILGVGQFEHIIAYALTSLALCLGYTDRKQRLLIGLGLSSCAGVLELAQLWVPGRVSQFSDFAAGCFGAWAIVCLAELTSGVFRREQNPK